MKRIAIIGTAGRGQMLTLNQWNWMVDAATVWAGKGNHLISGGAAWADHLAVELYMTHKCEELTLHLPAPWSHEHKCFVGGRGTAGSAANYYHNLFSNVLGKDTLEEIDLVLHGGAQYTFQQEAQGYRGMFARNALVAAESDGMLAFTFGEGEVPADGGTLDTWNKHMSQYKKHFSIPYI